MIRARLGATILMLVVLVGGCGPAESRFCSDFRRVDKALGPLRAAEDDDEFERVPSLVDDVADAYEGIKPPAVLQQDWITAVEFFRQQAETARIILRAGQVPETSAEDDARKSRAFTNISEYGIAHCGRVRGQLVP